MIGGGREMTSPSSPWTVVAMGKEAPGGLSIGELPPWGEAACGVGALAALLLLKTSPPPESSSSEETTNTLFPLSRGVGDGDVATARGTAAMGGGEPGVWICGGGEDGPSGGAAVGSAAIAEGARGASALAARAAFIAFASV